MAKKGARKTAKKATRATAATRRIGLSLGADICWPKCFEDLLGDLDFQRVG